MGHYLYSSHSPRIALLIDGQNLFSAARQLGFNVDLKRLLNCFRQQGIVRFASLYVVVGDDQMQTPAKPLLDWFDCIGYRVAIKTAVDPAIERCDTVAKDDMKVELCVDALELVREIDQLVLFAGSRDYTALIAAIQRYGTQVTVVSTMRTRPSHISHELVRQANTFVDLVDLEPDIAYRH